MPHIQDWMRGALKDLQGIKLRVMSYRVNSHFDWKEQRALLARDAWDAIILIPTNSSLISQ